MKVEIKVPDTVQFCVRMEKEDELYPQCMWARITFDNKNWSMMAQSDVGDYSYEWYLETGGRRFLDLMQQIDKDYLLCKISDMTQFDLYWTKRILIDCVSDEDQSEHLIKEINFITACNPYEFMEEISNIDGMEEYTNLWECIQYDYPQRAKVFAKVFTECIQPEIRKYLSR